MRKLGLKDAFALARIIKAANLRDEIIRFAEDIRTRKEKTDAESVGLEFFVTLIESVADEAVEQKIFALYADLKGVTPEEVGMYGLETLKADIKELIEQNDLKSFFNSASALISK